MWEGVQETKWSFLSPPWQLRDKGKSDGPSAALLILINLPKQESELESMRYTWMILWALLSMELTTESITRIWQ